MPSSNPRDAEDILRSVADTYNDIDPAIDYRKGPIAVIDYGYAQELAKTEDSADYLRSVYQLANPELLDDNDIVQLGLNYGKDPNIGKAARVLVFLYRLSRPEENVVYTAEAGTLISSNDGRFVYSLLTDATMTGNFADVYFNATLNRYEVSVMAEAIAIGVDYNLPPYTIAEIATPVEGFDGAVNKDYAIGGTDPVDKNQFRRIIWDALQGIGGDLAGKIFNIISDLDPTGFDDISMIPSSDYQNFARLSVLHSKLGYDMYLISDSIEETLQTGFSQGGEMSLPLEKKPVLAVRFVSLNGVEIPFSLNSDQDPAYTGSPLADDRVHFTSPLPPAQPYEIRYIYYKLIYDAHSALQDRTKPFQTDVLVRKATPIEIIIVGSISTFSSANKEDVINEVRSFTTDYLRNPVSPSYSLRSFYELLDPSDYQDSVESTINGVTDFQLERFARIDKAFMDIDVIYLNGLTEYAVLSPQFNVT